MVVEYRTFHNNDPPGLLDLWKASRDSRAFGIVKSCDMLEAILFSKPYFDRNGLIIAELDGRIIGFAHAGFAANDSKSKIDYTMGAVYMVKVHPDLRHRGIGTNLLHLAQDYLVRLGAVAHYFGGMFPMNAFYLGLYGGSELPGILNSDEVSRTFAEKHGYEPVDTCCVYQRRLEELPKVPDTRIHLLRRTVEVQAEPWPLPPTWWDACVLGNMPSLRYEMVEKDTQNLIGQAWVWEMESFGLANGAPTVGIVDFSVREELRRRGYGKLLLLTMLKHLREQQIEIVELQTMERNDSARGLYESLGFQQVDTGRAYRLPRQPVLDNLPPLVRPSPAPRTDARPRFARGT